jgi:hypothetical protein
MIVELAVNPWTCGGPEHRHLPKLAAILAVVLAVLLAGCAAQVAPTPDRHKREPAELADTYYQGLLAQGKPVFGVDSARSIVVIEVRRGGSFAHLGHDHVVASHDVAGHIAPGEGRADLRVPLDALVVDEPALRAEAGFHTALSADDIAGTRGNMLAKVLEADRYPYARITVSGLGSRGSPMKLQVDITLHGVTRSVQTAVEFLRTDEELSVSGVIAIDQSEYGIVPLSVLGGAIAVQDRLNMSYRIYARRMQ